MRFQMKTNWFENALKKVDTFEKAGISLYCARSKTEPFQNYDFGWRQSVVQPLFRASRLKLKQICRTSKYIFDIIDLFNRSFGT